MSRLNNHFGFTGNVGVEPEIKFNPNNGDPIARLQLGVDASYKKDGEKIERTDWIELTVYFKGLVDVIQKYVKKGRQLQVGGHTRKAVWLSKDRKDADGNQMKDSRYEFVVTELLLLGSGNKDGADQQEGRSYSAPEGSVPDDDGAY